MKHQSLNPEYVNDKDFRLMFLRCERFRPKPAAERIVTHFLMKKIIFGCPHQKDKSMKMNEQKKQKVYVDEEVHVFARPVLMSDLYEEDLAVLERGFHQILPQRDAAGRMVICASNNFLAGQDFLSLVR